MLMFLSCTEKQRGLLEPVPAKLLHVEVCMELGQRIRTEKGAEIRRAILKEAER